MKKKYTVDYFIKKFSLIPHDDWCIGTYHVSETDQCCALGHCGMNEDYTPPMAKALIGHFANRPFSVSAVNDGEVKKFRQKTPRTRVIAALREIKKKASK